MKAAVNLMPRGELELEDEVTTVEHLREGDRRMVARGQQRWTYYARDPATNRIAGYTEVGWHPERPWLLWQDDTAVFTEYQNRGLGRWLKAEMLDRVLAERPEVRVVRTGNAQSNAPMLNINVALGFRPYREYVEWQVERSAVDAYLDAAAGDSGS